MSKCEETLKTTQAAFTAAENTANTTIKGLQDEINVLTSDYLTCKAEERKNYGTVLTPEQEDEIESPAKCDFEKYKTDVTAKKVLIADAEKTKEDPKEKLDCAKYSYTKAALNLIGNEFDSFDIEKNLNVGNEASLDLVKDVNKNENILKRVLKLLTQVLGTFAVLMLIIGAYYLITSQGDESQLQKGKNIFFYTIIGLLIAFMSFIAVQFVISVIFTTAA